MTLREATDCGVMIVNNDDSFCFNGMCKDCKHSQCYSSPAPSNMCMNEKSEWHGSYLVNHNLMRYVNGCSVFEN